MAIYGKLNLSILIWKIIGEKTFEILDLSIGKEPPIVAKSKDKSGFLHIQSNNYKWIFHTFLVISELADPCMAQCCTYLLLLDMTRMRNA